MPKIAKKPKSAKKKWFPGTARSFLKNHDQPPEDGDLRKGSVLPAPRDRSITFTRSRKIKLKVGSREALIRQRDTANTKASEDMAIDRALCLYDSPPGEGMRKIKLELEARVPEVMVQTNLHANPQEGDECSYIAISTALGIFTEDRSVSQNLRGKNKTEFTRLINTIVLNEFESRKEPIQDLDFAYWLYREEITMSLHFLHFVWCSFFPGVQFAKWIIPYVTDYYQNLVGLDTYLEMVKLEARINRLDRQGLLKNKKALELMAQLTNVLGNNATGGDLKDYLCALDKAIVTDHTRINWGDELKKFRAHVESAMQRCPPVKVLSKSEFLGSIHREVQNSDDVVYIVNTEDSPGDHWIVAWLYHAKFHSDNLK